MVVHALAEMLMCSIVVTANSFLPTTEVFKSTQCNSVAHNGLFVLDHIVCERLKDHSEEIGSYVVTAQLCVRTKLSVSSWTRWTVLFPASARACSSAAISKSAFNSKPSEGVSLPLPRPSLNAFTLRDPAREIQRSPRGTGSATDIVLSRMDQPDAAFIWITIHVFVLRTQLYSFIWPLLSSVLWESLETNVSGWHV